MENTWRGKSLSGFFIAAQDAAWQEAKGVFGGFLKYPAFKEEP